MGLRSVILGHAYPPGAGCGASAARGAAATSPAHRRSREIWPSSWRARPVRRDEQVPQERLRRDDRRHSPRAAFTAAISSLPAARTHFTARRLVIGRTETDSGDPEIDQRAHAAVRNYNDVGSLEALFTLIPISSAASSSSRWRSSPPRERLPRAGDELAHARGALVGVRRDDQRLSLPPERRPGPLWREADMATFGKAIANDSRGGSVRPARRDGALRAGSDRGAGVPPLGDARRRDPRLARRWRHRRDAAPRRGGARSAHGGALDRRRPCGGARRRPRGDRGVCRPATRARRSCAATPTARCRAAAHPLLAGDHGPAGPHPVCGDQPRARRGRDRRHLGGGPEGAAVYRQALEHGTERFLRAGPSKRSSGVSTRRWARSPSRVDRSAAERAAS